MSSHPFLCLRELNRSMKTGALHRKQTQIFYFNKTPKYNWLKMNKRIYHGFLIQRKKSVNICGFFIIVL